VKKKVKEYVEFDIKVLKQQEAHRLVTRKYKSLLGRIERAEKERDAVKQIREVSTFKISPKTKNGTSEATAVVVASDWHYEERVKSVEVNGLNEFNLVVAKKRIEQFFVATNRMLEVYQKDTKIPHLVLALLGDFINNDIHEEMAETNQLTPIEAVIEVQKLIASGIEFLLDHYNGMITIPCHSGNHARTTQKSRNATEAGHSLEYFMYHSLAKHFKSKNRVRFVISPSYHSYVSVYDYVIRFHHGHNIRYLGGIGGLFVPTFKAISQWNKGNRADLDVFGHFHSMRDGGNFICNGSLVGFNAYALSIKAEYEQPKQVFFLIDKKRGKTVTTPICFDI